MNKIIELDYILNYSNSYGSIYKRILKGTVGNYEELPIKIDVYINGVKSSPVNILNKDNKITEFEKDLFLSDGNNVIEIVVIDANGNTTSKKSEVYIDCMPEKPEKEILLENFIGNDDKNVELHLGNADLRYDNPEAGLQKDVLIDTSITSHFFQLNGTKANLYRISRDNIPEIKSEIIKRPLAVNFDYIEKIYDGNNDITLEANKLKFNDGYYVYDIHSEYNEFSSSGFVRGTKERRVTSEIIFNSQDIIPNQVDLNILNIDYNTFYMKLDEYEGYGFLDETSGNAEIIFNLPEVKLIGEYDKDNNLTYDTMNILLYGTQKKINEYIDKYNHTIISNDSLLEGLFYSIYKNDDGETIYLGANTLNCFNDNNQRIKRPVTKEFKSKNECILWLSALYNKISKIELIKNNISTDENINNYYTIMKFTYLNELEHYEVINNVNIKYNYTLLNEDSNENVYRTSDSDLLEIEFSKVFFTNKNVTDEIQPLTYNDIKFSGMAANNYQIANYSGTGKILKRTINPHIECLDKVYDGSKVVPFKMSDKFYNGFENAIEKDNIFIIDDTYEGDKDDEFHFFEKSRKSVLVFENEDVGDNKLVSINKLYLEGSDAKNYELGQITSNFRASIKIRPIEVVIDKIYLIRSKRAWEIEYHFINDIENDKLSICYNTHDNNDIIVYGGIDKDGNSIHENYEGKANILSMFFEYPFNHEYKFVDINTELQNVKNTDTNYWLNDARPAEPDTKRIDIIPEYDTSYSGNIKLSLDSLSNGVRTSYFESQNKDYKLYNGCKVTITNICLNPLNDKIKNYKLLNNKYETTIEII